MMKKKTTRRKSLMKDFLDNIQLSRRSFIKASSATGVAVVLGAGLKPEMKALAVATVPSTEGMGKWMPATCQGCTSWCSQQVYIIDGRAVKVRG
ncbi:MAG: twin-arginine translocation signal domain-containing protein, partial [Deltaproteobacteria bacterium]|nr:twin-arginine translocation signal domain-containing protein [Deltaproteobacteria bacterium]